VSFAVLYFCERLLAFLFGMRIVRLILCQLVSPLPGRETLAIRLGSPEGGFSRHRQSDCGP
jgi:hypothetical protein